jgi:transposase
MYLLEGRKAPDHNTISRFRTNILSKGAGQELLKQLIQMLIEAGLIDLKRYSLTERKSKPTQTNTASYGRKPRSKS